MTDLVTLADAVLCSFWFQRRQAWTSAQHDESWCTFCKGKGGYHEYGLDWHDDDCVIRLACRVLGRTDPLGYSVLSDRQRKRVMAKAAA